MKQSQELQIKMTLRCLENMITREEEEKDKQRIQNILKRIEKTRDKRELGHLNPYQAKMFMLLSDGFTAYKEAFLELTKMEKYKAVNDTYGFDINEYLLGVQSAINITKDILSIDGVVSKYAVNIIKLKKNYDSWPKELISDWNTKSKEKMKKLESKRFQSKKRVEEQKPDRYSDSEQNQSEQQKPKPPPVQRPEPERKYMPDKQQQQQRKMEPRLDINKATESTVRDFKTKLMERYLQSRKDLHIEKTRMKQIAEFMTSRLDNFMRKTIEKIIDIGCLKNKKNWKTGNEMTYFSPNSDRAASQTPFYISPNSKIFLLQYKHKLEIYTTLRAKEIKKEDELRSALEANTNQNEKKVDKKIENYILKPRAKEVEPIEIFKEEKETGKPANNLMISVEHTLYYLENHRFLKNSLLLFNAYHY